MGHLEDEIREIYRRERPATGVEAEATRAAVRDDPAVARAHWEVLRSLAEEDRSFAMLFGLLLQDLLIEVLAERVAADDAFALRAGRRSLELMERLARPPRGKPGKVKTV